MFVLTSYALGTAVVLLVGVFFQPHRINRGFLNAVLLSPTWFSRTREREKYSGEIEGLDLDSPTGESLPDSARSNTWWKDQELYQLEQRAIFSKAWHFITHKSQFQKPGDYRTFELAGFSIIVILGKDKQLRAFQNICRHRAYQITRKECGSSTVLGCRYHGWSYDTTGKLIKAPEFENIEGFDKNMNGLWQIKLEVKKSMVFINLDSSNQRIGLEHDEWDSAFNCWDSTHVYCAVEWKVDGKFNWKLAAEDFSQLLAKKDTRGSFSWLIGHSFNHYQRDVKLGVTAATWCLSLGMLLTLRLIPRSAAVTTVHCSIYKDRTTNAKTDLELKSVKTEIELGIQQLEKKQESLFQGDGNLSRQQGKLRQILQEHADAEKRLGREIHPAAQKEHVTAVGKADDEFCRKLEIASNSAGAICSASARGLLDW